MPQKYPRDVVPPHVQGLQLHSVGARHAAGPLPEGQAGGGGLQHCAEGGHVWEEPAGAHRGPQALGEGARHGGNAERSRAL